jgi:hypothetical protein
MLVGGVVLNIVVGIVAIWVATPVNNLPSLTLWIFGGTNLFMGFGSLLPFRARSRDGVSATDGLQIVRTLSTARRNRAVTHAVSKWTSIIRERGVDAGVEFMKGKRRTGKDARLDFVYAHSLLSSSVPQNYMLGLNEARAILDATAPPTPIRTTSPAGRSQLIVGIARCQAFKLRKSDGLWPQGYVAGDLCISEILAGHDDFELRAEGAARAKSLLSDHPQDGSALDPDDRASLANCIAGVIVADPTSEPGLLVEAEGYAELACALLPNHGGPIDTLALVRFRQGRLTGPKPWSDHSWTQPRTRGTALQLK